MLGIIERIAHFADIDTRRAMGFQPRRLIVPSFNIRIPKEYRSGHVFVVNFDSLYLLSFQNMILNLYV